MTVAVVMAVVEVLEVVVIDLRANYVLNMVMTLLITGTSTMKISSNLIHRPEILNEANPTQSSNVQPRAYIATQLNNFTSAHQDNVSNDLQMWHLDSKASHHVTSDAQHFTHRT